MSKAKAILIPTPISLEFIEAIAMTKNLKIVIIIRINPATIKPYFRFEVNLNVLNWVLIDYPNNTLKVKHYSIFELE